MQPKIQAMLSLVVSAILLGMPLGAFASDPVYKFRQPNGVVVYTDQLNDLPEKIRQQYYQAQMKRDALEQELMRRIGEEEYKKRKAEEEREKVLKMQIQEAERQKRLMKLDHMIAEIRENRTKRDAEKNQWTSRIATTRKKLVDAVTEFQKEQEAYQRIAIQPSFTLLPGQAEAMEKHKKRADQLEIEIDALIEEIQVRIPEEARRAGIPPGWLR